MRLVQDHGITVLEATDAELGGLANTALANTALAIVGKDQMEAVIRYKGEPVVALRRITAQEGEK